MYITGVCTVYDFSDPYYEDENAILVKASDVDKYTSIDSLSGAKVAVQKGTVEEDLAKKQLENANIISLTSMGDLLQKVTWIKTQIWL